jgi:putative phage-type endonuclease
MIQQTPTTPAAIFNTFAAPPVPGTREAWLAERMTLLTASDVPAALGLSPWKSPLELWAEKTGTLDAEDIGDRDCVKWGLRLERPIAEGYAEDTGRQVTMWPAHTLKRSDSVPFLGATPDATQHAMQFDDEGALQIKTTSAYKKADWSDEPPIYYQIQLQTELFVTGMPWGTLAALIGGQQLVWFDQPRNDRFLDAMLPKLEAFWELVKSKTPPPAGNSAADWEVLKRLYGKDTGEEIFDNSPELAQAATDLTGAREKAKALDEIETAAKNIIIAKLGGAASCVLADGRTITARWIDKNMKAKEAHIQRSRPIRVK